MVRSWCVCRRLVVRWSYDGVWLCLIGVRLRQVVVRYCLEPKRFYTELERYRIELKSKRLAIIKKKPTGRTGSNRWGNALSIVSTLPVAQRRWRATPPLRRSIGAAQ